MAPLARRPRVLARRQARRSGSSTGAGGAQRAKIRPQPLGITRLHFKQDVDGYLATDSFTQLFLWDLATSKLEKLTTDTRVDETDAVWSADGGPLAWGLSFLSNGLRQSTGQTR